MVRDSCDTSVIPSEDVMSLRLTTRHENGQPPDARGCSADLLFKVGGFAVVWAKSRRPQEQVCSTKKGKS